MSKRLYLAAAALLCAAAACGGSDLSGAGGPCTSASDCKGSLVCDQATGTCGQGAECTAHSDCGLGAYCAPSGSCEGNSADGPCDTSDNCVSGQTCSGGTCTGGGGGGGGDVDAGCGGELYSATNVPPNMLIVLDRTGSMNQNNKWPTAQDAISGLLTDLGTQIRFGLMLFPGTNQSCSAGVDCGPGTVFYDPAADNASTVNPFLQNAGTCSFSTPIAATLDDLVGYSGLQDTERPNYVVLVTDGEERCGGDPVASVTALRDQTPEVKTFVIGFDTGVDSTQLNDMATAGGTARPSQPYYYVADNGTDLKDALAEIAGSVLSCSYTLSKVPPNTDDLSVFFDGTEIQQDGSHTAGWDYDAGTNQVTFYGNACDSLQSGEVSDLQVVFGCPGGVIVN